jgi:hypothetical protein
MKKIIFCSMFAILIFGFAGCGTGNSGGSATGQGSEISTESKQEGDFEVSINVGNDGEDVDAYATITYVGEEDKTDIYHGESIFLFNIYQQDGDFEHGGGMGDIEVTTTLTKNEPHNVELYGMDVNALEPGTYEFEAVADFSLDEENMLDSQNEIVVSTIIEID